MNGKTPKWEKEENIKKVFLALMREPLTFNELLEKLQTSRGALAGHLRELQEKRIIERTRRQGKRVYKIVFDDEEKIIDELKGIHFDVLIELFSDVVNSTLAEVWKAYLETMAKVIIYFKKRQLLGKPRLYTKDLILTPYRIIKESSSPKIRQLTHADEIIREIEKLSDSKFGELENLRRSMDIKLKKGKKNEGEN